MIYEMTKNLMSIFSSSENQGSEKAPQTGVGMIIEQASSCDGTWEIVYHKKYWTEELEFICRPFIRIVEPNKPEDKKNE